MQKYWLKGEFILSKHASSLYVCLYRLYIGYIGYIFLCVGLTFINETLRLRFGHSYQIC